MAIFVIFCTDYILQKRPDQREIHEIYSAWKLIHLRYLFVQMAPITYTLVQLHLIVKLMLSAVTLSKDYHEFIEASVSSM